MALLSKLVLLHKSKIELLEKIKDSSINDSQHIELKSQLNELNKQINKLKLIVYKNQPASSVAFLKQTVDG
jgi:hypothetical protein